MKYILKYTSESKYFHFVRENEKQFKTFNELRNYLILNISKIKDYNIYKLTDLSNK